MKFATSICRDWRTFKFGIRPPVRERGPVFDTNSEAEQWIKEQLDVLYPSQWQYNGHQYLHNESLPGDEVIAMIDRVYSDEERQEHRIAALKKTIADAQAELDTLQRPAAPAEPSAAAFEPQYVWDDERRNWFPKEGADDGC